jgi:hypothetical protein
MTQRELIDLSEVIREMVALLRDTARRHSISIRSELDPPLPAAPINQRSGHRNNQRIADDLRAIDRGIPD